ncbi:MAG: hypothetical protein GEV10_17570 [Streptosporangiales bacterium]|nr:hypothetical protein [Streptosporangiales bacterium]
MHLRTLSTWTAAVVAGTLLAGCTGTGGDSGDDEFDGLRPVAQDVSGRTRVPAIRLLTKTAAEDPRRYEQTRLIAERWKTAGIPAQLTPVRGTELTRRAFTSKDFDAFVVTYDPTPERLDPDDFLRRFTTANATEAGSNNSGFANASYDKYYAAQRSATTEKERRTAVFAAQKLLYEQQPARPFAHLAIAGAYRSDRWANIEKAAGNPVFNIWNSIGAKPTTGRRNLVVGTIAEPPTLNPVALDTTEALLPLSHVYDSLVRIGPDGNLRNWAADDITENGETVTARLRPGMRFSDGSPVTAADVAFTIDYLVEEKSPLFGPKLEEVESVKTSGRTITITLKAPSAAFVSTVLSQMPILPKHVWRKVQDPTTYANASPVGSGPFSFASRNLGSELRFTANRSHFFAPRIDGLTMAVLGSFDAEVGALGRGDIDMIGDQQSVAQLKTIQNKPDIAIVKTDSFGWSGVHYNMRGAPFDDLHFRRALSYLVPVQDIIDIALDGQGRPAGSVIAPSLREWYDPSLEPYPYDPQAAMKELRKAGYAFDEDGVLYYPAKDADRRVRQSPSP